MRFRVFWARLGQGIAVDVIRPANALFAGSHIVRGKYNPRRRPGDRFERVMDMVVGIQILSQPVLAGGVEIFAAERAVILVIHFFFPICSGQAKMRYASFVSPAFRQSGHRI